MSSTAIIPRPPLLKFEPVEPPTMRWKCTACLAVFQGPVNRAPANGCPTCGSRQVFDVNVEGVSIRFFNGLN